MEPAATLLSIVPPGRLHARLLLATFFLAAGFFVAVTLSPLARGFADAADRGPGDLGLYHAEVDRIRSGETYYDAAAAELTERGYPTRSVFNWRTPLPVWLVGMLPETVAASALLVAIGMALAAMSFGLLADEADLGPAILAVLLLMGALLPCFLGRPVLSAELWSGVLLALSAVSFGRGQRAAGVIAGVTALVFRELAAPYCLLCIGLAAAERRWRELAWWSVGLAGYGLFYAFHLSQVLPRITPEATAHADGWLRFGGAGFLISTAQMNAFLLLLPQWVTGIYLACALLGAATWNTPAGRLIGGTVALYVVAFSVVGNDFNQYWGSQIAPLLCLPAALAPAALRQLWRRAHGKTARLGTGHQPASIVAKH